MVGALPPQLDPDDVSLRIDKVPLDMREIATLRRHGIATISELAAADLDQLLEWYLPEVTHREGAEGRIRVAARRARMLLEGSSFDRETTGPIEVPRADVEIDLDIESSADGRIYLWGFLVQQGADEPAVYHEFSRFDDLDNQSEAALAADAFTWLRSVVDSASSVVVFHYSGYEVAKISELAGRDHDELFAWAAGYAEEHFVDLLEIVKAHYFGVSGLGLKLMARHVGFSWRDEDPGGLNSQLWFADAVHGERLSAHASATPGTGIQRGRCDRNQPGQSVAASAMISRSSVRRCARSIIGVDKLQPGGRFRQHLGQLVDGLHTPIADPGGRRQILEPQSYRCAEESLKGAHVRRLALLQSGEDAATVIVGYHEPEIRPRLFSSDHQSGHVMQRSQITHQRMGRALQSQRNAGSRRDAAVNPRKSSIGVHQWRCGADGGEIEITDRAGGSCEQNVVSTEGSSRAPPPTPGR